MAELLLTPMSRLICNRCRDSSHGRGDRTRTGGMGALNWLLTRAYSQDATISPVSWGLSGAEIPAYEPVARRLPIGRLAGAFDPGDDRDPDLVAGVAEPRRFRRLLG